MSEEIRCERCDAKLKESQAVWLELWNPHNTFHEEGEVPPEESQGFFAFGKDCAKQVLKERN